MTRAHLRATPLLLLREVAALVPAAFQESLMQHVLPAGEIFVSLSGFTACFSCVQESGVESDALSNVARQIMYNWPQVLGSLPRPVITAARVALDSGRAARSTFSRIIQDLPRGL